jgi:anaphase-promoting complex subunit 1
MFDSQETITESHVRREVEQEDDQDATVEDGGVWWMRDSVIENLKGMVWLASREGEH